MDRPALGSGAAYGLPNELWAAVAEASDLSTGDIARLAAVAPWLQWLAPYEEEVRRRAALETVAEPCADYLGCVGAFMAAIVDDDADTVAALVDSGRIPIDEPIDLNTVEEYAGWQTGLDVASDAPTWRHLIPGLPFMRYATGSAAGYPYATPLSVAAAAGAQRSAARLMRLGAAAWPSPEALLAYAVHMPLATRVRRASAWFDGLHAYNPVATIFGPWRAFDTAAMVRRIARTHPRSTRLGPWDDSPLTALLHGVVHGTGYGAPPSDDPTGQWPRRVVDIATTLLQAGYSPDERAFGEARTRFRHADFDGSVRELTRQELADAEEQLEARIADASKREGQEMNNFGDGRGPWANRERAVVNILGALDNLYDTVPERVP
ncbi:hypothetical protein pqer_cds_422 [Pandoravirus quercus]|uniref:Uncharacterized protein n=1 Tax=Pandoravirus quercus TaxID=2107709 RepID=A0A2U7U8S7_9VIRU|nr:hypothetical protein pqer_cds_422 [Pandoravirus quercus]AVK74844.1 hypothetical protein pqer_cds_422 [Pandoravirus quercus]